MAAFIAIGMTGWTQVQTVPVNKNEKNLEGTIYTLPKTVLIVEVKTKSTKITPGQYWQYAERFLGTTNVCQSENTSYEITSVNVTPKPVPDKGNTYIVVKGNSKKPTTVELTPEGFLISLNGKQKTNIYGIQPKARTDNKEDKDYQTMSSSIITREMQQSTSTAKIAELAANEIFTIRDARNNILTQDIDKTPADGRSYEIVLSELNRMERYYVELFTGKKEEKEQTTKFEIYPENLKSPLLFRFSKQKGIVDKSDLGGSPVNIKIVEIPSLAYDNVNPAKKEKAAGLYYRVPGKAKVTVSDDNNTFFENEIPIAQFGNVVTLPSEATMQVKLCPLTGALLQSGN